MPDSLNQSKSVFSGLRWSQVVAFIEVMRECKRKDEAYIQKRYGERATNYLVARDFLKSLRLLKLSSGVLELKAGIAGLNTHELREFFLGKILKASGEHGQELGLFLGNFRMIDEQLRYRPIEAARSFESSVRNFLMDLKVLIFVREREHYLMAPNFATIYGRYLASASGMSPNRVSAALEGRLELGLQAEKLIVRFEEERLGVDLAQHVEHVALKNAGAGFDVLSLTTGVPGGPILRYIEVKAVSQSTFQFYWSKNERDCAEMFGSAYYLYLLPITQNGEMVLDALRIIQDPIHLLKNKADWVVQPDAVICTPKKLNGIRG